MILHRSAFDLSRVTLKRALIYCVVLVAKTVVVPSTTVKSKREKQSKVKATQSFSKLV